MTVNTNTVRTVTGITAADRLSLGCLLLGAIIGIGLGGLTAAGWIDTDPLPHSLIARVNDTEIPLREYERALRLFASEKREPINAHDRALILERMIEEELLVQAAVASGLVRGDRGVRTTILRTLLAGLMIELEAEAPANGPGDLENLATMDADQKLDTSAASRDALLRDYLGRLRDSAEIRWVDKGGRP